MSRTANGSGNMFDGIASRYDLMNRVMSFGLDRRWRRRLVTSLGLPQPSCGKLAEETAVLDVATGTGDVALAIARHYPYTIVHGMDPSCGMLEVGRQKVSQATLEDRVKLEQGDAQAMPYEDGKFAAACISFGIRNVPNRRLGLEEMARVTQPGGKVCVLELSEPTGLLGPFARFHVHHVVPTIGALLSGEKEYRYLQASIQAFPAAADFAALMGEAGLCHVEVIRLSFGAVHLYVGEVSGRSAP